MLYTNKKIKLIFFHSFISLFLREKRESHSVLKIFPFKNLNISYICLSKLTKPTILQITIPTGPFINNQLHKQTTSS